MVHVHIHVYTVCPLECSWSVTVLILKLVQPVMKKCFRFRPCDCVCFENSIHIVQVIRPLVSSYESQGRPIFHLGLKALSGHFSFSYLVHCTCTSQCLGLFRLISYVLGCLNLPFLTRCGIVYKSNTI